MTTTPRIVCGNRFLSGSECIQSSCKWYVLWFFSDVFVIILDTLLYFYMLFSFLSIEVFLSGINNFLLTTPSWGPIMTSDLFIHCHKWPCDGINIMLPLHIMELQAETTHSSMHAHQDFLDSLQAQVWWEARKKKGFTYLLLAVWSPEHAAFTSLAWLHAVELWGIGLACYPMVPKTTSTHASDCVVLGNC